MSAAARDEELPPPPPIRIRTVLAVALLGGGLWWATPRVQAMFDLHATAQQLADYGACMAGPTGPKLLRDNPPRFQALVRRRLIISPAKARPFANCANLAGELTGKPEIARAHRATAWSFVEYGGKAADVLASGGTALSLRQLRVTTRRLAVLAREAWPFARGYTKLVRPSLRAREATHPLPLPRAAAGNGLPGWRAWYRAVGKDADGNHVLAVGHGANLATYQSQDGGLHWSAVRLPVSAVNDFAERCPAGPRSFTVGQDEGGSRLIVTSLGPDHVPHATELTSSQRELVSFDCDAEGVVAATRAPGSRDVQLHLCPYQRSCAPLEMPLFPGVGARPKLPLDVARVNGFTVLATVMHGIVRVTSSRDDGRTWTPFTVAFDRHAHPEQRFDVAVPDRLLAVDDRLLLHGSPSRPGATYPVLVSDNGGASWKPLVPSSAPVARQARAVAP